MSLATWKAEFYVPPSRWTKANALDCVLEKYLGTRKKALARHHVRKAETRPTLHGWGQPFPFNTATCALCSCYWLPDTRECSPECPLVTKYRRWTGEGRPYTHWRETGDPEPMIRALRRAIKKRDAAKEPRP